MIDVKPEGRLANNLFQYVFARLIHESTGLAVNYTVNTSIFTTPPIEGTRGEGQRLLVTDFFDTGKDSVLDLREVSEACREKNVLVHGFFQNKSYFNHRRDEVKAWLGHIPKVNPHHTGIHIRKTDYVTLGWDLPDEYYDECIKLANPTNLMVFTDDPRNPYVRKLLSQGAELDRSPPEEAMFLLGTCAKQIIARSTFSWWSAFLSTPDVVMYPRPKTGWWSEKDTPYKVLDVDSPEYRYIDL